MRKLRPVLLATLLLPCMPCTAFAQRELQHSRLRRQVQLVADSPRAARLTPEHLHRLALAVRAARDSSAVPALMEVIRTRPDTAALSAVLELGSLEQHRTLAALVESRARLWITYLAAFENAFDAGEPLAIAKMTDPFIRTSVTRIARTALVRPDSALIRGGVPSDGQMSELHRMAINILARWGNDYDPAILSGLFHDPRADAYFLARGLVLLTAEFESPKADRTAASASQKQALEQFWTAWWQRKRTTFQVDPNIQHREDAVTRWLTRHNLPICCQGI